MASRLTAAADWLATVRRSAVQHSFASAGARLRFSDEGAGEPVVLVHGFAVNADLNWRAPGIIRALRAKLRVIALDLRGHGCSDKPHDLASYGSHLIDDVPRLLDHLGLARCHLVGYSLGGFVALKAACVHPDRLLSASVLGAGWEEPGDGPLARALPALVAALERGGIGPLSGHLGDDRPRPSLPHALWVWTMTRFFNDRRALMQVVRSVPALALEEHELRAIAVPICSIVGEHDPMVVGARAMSKRLADVSATIISGADHISAPMRPELSAALLRFLTRS